MRAEEGLDLEPEPARASRWSSGHGVLGLHPPMLPDHSAPGHDGSAGRLQAFIPYQPNPRKSFAFILIGNHPFRPDSTVIEKDPAHDGLAGWLYYSGWKSMT
jgi:hypothetical protein